MTVLCKSRLLQRICCQASVVLLFIIFLISQVSSSVIGRGCRIGKGAQIQGSYLHDNVTVWEGAQVDTAVLCEGVTVMPNASIKEGSIVSFKVFFLPKDFGIKVCKSTLSIYTRRKFFNDLRIQFAAQPNFLSFRLSSGGARL